MKPNETILIETQTEVENTQTISSFNSAKSSIDRMVNGKLQTLRKFSQGNANIYWN